MLLACDSRVGTSGEFLIGLNETAIGMSFPVFGHELATNRLSKRHLTSALIQSQLYSPEEAVDAGFLDLVVGEDELIQSSLDLAKKLAELPGEAYAKNRLDSRKLPIDKIRQSLA